MINSGVNPYTPEELEQLLRCAINDCPFCKENGEFCDDGQTEDYGKRPCMFHPTNEDDCVVAVKNEDSLNNCCIIHMKCNGTFKARWKFFTKQYIEANGDVATMDVNSKPLLKILKSAFPESFNELKADLVILKNIKD